MPDSKTHVRFDCTRGKNFSLNIEYKYRLACKTYRNKEEMKTQEYYPAAEKSW